MARPSAPARVALDVTIDAPVERVFDGFSQWGEQGRWIAGTQVEVQVGDGRSVGSQITARTGAGRAAFRDTMVITRWEPPYRIDVRHIGRVVRGTGTMEVLALPGGRSRFVWSENLDLPLGRLGRLGWPIARPALLLGARASLSEFRRLVEQRVLPR